VRVAPFTNWFILEFIIGAATSDGDIENILDQFNQRLKDSEELVFPVESCTPRIPITIIRDE
jgi:hypothetical protein